MKEKELENNNILNAYTVLSTRPAEKFTSEKEHYHYNLINIPLTKLKRRKIDSSHIALIKKFDPDVIIITSSYGAIIFIEDIWKRLHRKDLNFIAIGASTAEPLIKEGINVYIPENKSTNGIIELLKERIPRESRIIIMRSDKGNPILNRFLEMDKRDFVEIVLYNILEDFENRETLLNCLRSKDLSAIILTSSMEANIFFKILKDEKIKIHKETVIYAIGEPTKEKIISSGFTGKILTGKSNFESILNEIEKTNSGEWI